MYSAYLGLKDNLEDMLRKGHCNSTKTHHLFLPCSMLHGSLLPEEKQSEVPLLNSVTGLSEKKTKELLSRLLFTTVQPKTRTALPFLHSGGFSSVISQ